MARKTTPSTIDEAFIGQVCTLLDQNSRVRFPLAHGGLLHIERQLPFLCVYRDPPGRTDEDTRRLVSAESAYLVGSGLRSQRGRLASLVEGIVDNLSPDFGAFLLLEIWAGDEVEANESIDPEALRPEFHIHVPKFGNGSLDRTVEALETGLGRVRVHKKKAAVEVSYDRRISPPGLPMLLATPRMAELNCLILGVEVQPVYRSVQADDSFPMVLRSVHRGMSRALRRGFFEFTRTRTTHRPPHFHSLGQKAVTKSMWEIDRRLEEISSSFDFLLQVTPVNISAAWRTFRRSKFERAPAFHYRPLPVDPSLLKKRLYSINLDRVEDPSLAAIFREKRGELDRQLTMLVEQGTRNFLLGSQQLYGPVSDDVMKVATEILERFHGSGRDDTFSGRVHAEEFAERARREIARFREHAPGIECNVLVTNEVSGLICSRGNLLVGASVKIPENRVEALIQHEVGTHLLTYHNGREQPFKLLSAGLAGYDELQEGLAVFSEYLVGGLSRARLKLLAGRVVAARSIVDGANFIETFRRLEREHGFEPHTAYRITTRIFRGGGLTKDAIYMRGLIRLLEYLGNGGNLEILFAGKLAKEHIPIIRELLHRGVLSKPVLEPTYLRDPRATRRLEAAKSGLSVLELLSRKKESK